MIASPKLHGDAPARDTPVRDALRRATDGAHARLHEHDGFAALLRGDLSRGDYGDLLIRLLGLHAPIEDKLLAYRSHPAMRWWFEAGRPEVGRVEADRPETGRVAALRSDIAALGRSAEIDGGMPRADALLPTIGSAIEALGCAWVVEGSALGGRVMQRSLAAILGTGDALQCGRFLGGDAAQPQRWRGCCEAVERYGHDATDRAAMAATASATFAAFEAWMTPLLASKKRQDTPALLAI